MTLSVSQVTRIETFDTVWAQRLDQELLYMIMAGLATAEVISEAWTGRPKLRAQLTDLGIRELVSFQTKQALEKVADQ